MPQTVANFIRQRRYFYYLSGCELADSCLTYDIVADKLTLFIPPVNPESVIWSGLPISVQEALRLYDVDDVKTTAEVNASLMSAQSKQTVYAIPGQVSDQITFLAFDGTEFALLKQAIEE